MALLNKIKSRLKNIKLTPKVRKLALSAISFAVVFGVIITVLSVSNLTYALSVSVNGNSYGFVRDEQDANDAIGNLLSRLVVADGDIATEPSVDCKLTVVSADSIISSNELAEKIVEHSDEYINAVAVYINGVLFAKADSNESVYELIYDEIGEALLYNNIELRESVMLKSSFDMLPYFEDVCHADVDAVVEYNVTDDTTHDDVSNAYRALGALDSIPDEFASGDVLTINAHIPAIAVKSTEEYTVTKSLTAYESGTKAGTLTTTFCNYSVQGIVYMTEEVSSEFVDKFADKPVATEIKDAGKNGWCWPVDTGYTQYTSSYWGDGRGHKGYDIACKTGTPILAVYDGYVESVNASGSGYGLHFVIKHPNGLRTLYSHCSKLYVSAGDTVTRGEVVALVGKTGKVTGSHLHFEVRKGSTPVNPINYIGKR